MHNLFLVYFINLYMFQAYLGPSSGGTTVCIQQLLLIIMIYTIYIINNYLSVYIYIISNFKLFSFQNNKYQLLHTYDYTS
jgi:hypothetical protein